MPKEVVVIGAGVSGLSCAVLLAERGYRTTIFAEETGAHTTSAVAAAIWFPYDAEPADAVITWSLETYGVLRELTEVAGSGVSMVELRSFSRAGELLIPEWAIPLGARPIAAPQIPPCFVSGYTLEVPLTDTTLYLNYLAARFSGADGKIQGETRFDHLEAVPQTDALVINCTGVGAKTIVPDPGVEPHRGQVVIVPKLLQRHAVVCDDSPLMYAIPRAGDCVFGGSNELSANRESDPASSARIVAECSRVLEIDPPEILREQVGLRPFRRAGICLRADRLRDGRRVIHNYGHGGSGFTLSWGCAHAVLALATAT